MLFLRYDGWELRVAVHDSGPDMPFVAEHADEGGRGLLLVFALSDKRKVGERELGKVVWCEWDLPIDGVGVRRRLARRNTKRRKPGTRSSWVPGFRCCGAVVLWCVRGVRGS